MVRPKPAFRIAFAPLFGLAFAVSLSCDRAPSEPKKRGETLSASPAPAVGVVLTEAPADGEVAPIVRQAAASAESEKRALLVYVGAVWCEPCQRFHDAAARDELNGLLPATTLLEFDLDRDQARLAAAGYTSAYIPLFALPKADGTASGRQVEGGIKGDGAVDFIVPHVQALLAR